MNPVLRRFIVPFFRSRIASIDGTENIPEPPYLIAANHIDFLDGFYLAITFLTTKNHWVTFLSKTNHYDWTGATVQIDPDQPASILERAADILRQHKVVCNFIEGQRNPTATLLPGKTGTVRLALMTGLPILPVGISGLTPTTYFWPSVWHTLRRKGTVRIRIGEPFNPPAIVNPAHEQLHTLTTELVRLIAPLCGKQPPPS